MASKNFGVILYDNKKKELLGSDGFFRPDGRKTIPTIVDQCRSRKYISPRAKFIRIIRGSILNPSYATGFIEV